MACGKLNIDDVDELVGIIFEGKVSVKAETTNYPASNEIKGYRVCNNSGSLPTSSPSEEAKADSSPEPAKKKLKPWEK